MAQGTWEAWVDQYYEPLLGRATAIFHGNTEQAVDFLHDLLLELRRKWDTIHNPLAWISSTMRYRLADYFHHAEESLSEEMAAQHEDVPLKVDIAEAVSRLPAGLAEVLTLFLEGNSIAEIVERTRLSPDAIYQRLSRARKLLKKNLGSEGYGQKMPIFPDEAPPFPI